jgi:hypothetical protein
MQTGPQTLAGRGRIVCAPQVALTKPQHASENYAALQIALNAAFMNAGNWMACIRANRIGDSQALRVGNGDIGAPNLSGRMSLRCSLRPG